MSWSERLHPEARVVLEQMAAEKLPPLDTMSPAEARMARNQWMKKLAGEPDALARVEDLTAHAPHGDVPVRVYADKRNSTADESQAALIYFHGGGFVLGNLETHDSVCRALARESGVVVVAVDYRLSPEHRFPAALEDAMAATRWVADNADFLGIDARRIAVGGDSVGGNLAALVAVRARDAALKDTGVKDTIWPQLAAQVLIYPITDFSSFENGSYREAGTGYNLTRAGMEWFRGHYLNLMDEAALPEVSPLLTQDLGGLPRAMVITAEFDPLRDEGEAYAERMRAAGVPVTLIRYPGMIHGFIAMRGALTDGRAGIRRIAEFLQAPQ